MAIQTIAIVGTLVTLVIFIAFFYFVYQKELETKENIKKQVQAVNTQQAQIELQQPEFVSEMEEIIEGELVDKIIYRIPEVFEEEFGGTFYNTSIYWNPADKNTPGIIKTFGLRFIGETIETKEFQVALGTATEVHVQFRGQDVGPIHKLGVVTPGNPPNPLDIYKLPIKKIIVTNANNRSVQFVVEGKHEYADGIRTYNTKVNQYTTQYTNAVNGYEAARQAHINSWPRYGTGDQCRNQCQCYQADSYQCVSGWSSMCYTVHGRGWYDCPSQGNTSTCNNCRNSQTEVQASADWNSKYPSGAKSYAEEAVGSNIRYVHYPNHGHTVEQKTMPVATYALRDPDNQVGEFQGTFGWYFEVRTQIRDPVLRAYFE